MTRLKEGAEVRLSIDPRTVPDLLADRDVVYLLTHGLVFIQDRRPSSEVLLGAMRRRVLALGTRCESLRWAKMDHEQIRGRLHAKATSRSRRDILEVEGTGDCTGLPAVLKETCGQFPHRTAMWVRAHARDMPPAALHLFDAVFLFDMAHDELEAVRTAIAVADEEVEQLRHRWYSADKGNPVCVYFGRDTDDVSIPLLLHNPAILSLKKDARFAVVSIDNFVPVVVEAVKFLFDRAGKRLDRGGRGSDDELPMEVGEYRDFQRNPRAYLVSELEYEQAVALENELRHLMSQISDRQRLVHRRAEKALLAGSDEQAKLELQNERDNAALDDEWTRLTTLLAGVLRT